ncbi:hypothetical protein H6P81_002881 [Aristolochia fimbriata]|uniref:Uncharacterized protein n=1 Tax=Aristolochia fimbriata TaxID=158543 RepID=A0AAV7FFJ5_ARIFI|nr:hypothetical protein H6P81_002881 [Aristolochia fimbriata]
MSLNMKTLTQALAKTAAIIEKTVQTTVQEVTGPKPLQDYDLIDQIGSGLRPYRPDRIRWPGPRLEALLRQAPPRLHLHLVSHPLQDYDLIDQIGSGGPGLAWKLYSAKARPSSTSTQYPIVCVWVIDKRAISNGRSWAGLSKAAEDAFFDFIRGDASRLVRLRHSVNRRTDFMPTKFGLQDENMKWLMFPL